MTLPSAWLFGEKMGTGLDQQKTKGAEKEETGKSYFSVFEQSETEKKE